MKWATPAYIHLDRVAALWLIKRFVDPDAEFSFVPWEGLRPTPPVEVPEGATPVGIPGAALGFHDEHGSCFAKVLRAYKLDDPALTQMERLVGAGVRHAQGAEPASDETAFETAMGGALDDLGWGFMLAFEDREHHLHSLTLYDGVYARCRQQLLPRDVVARMPRPFPARLSFLRDAIQGPGFEAPVIA